QPGLAVLRRRHAQTAGRPAGGNRRRRDAGPKLKVAMIILPDDATLPDNPRLGWRNLVTPGNVSASSEATGFPALNLGNETTFQIWRAAAAETVGITADLGGVVTVDYVGIARHNFGSEGYSYT